MRKIFLYFIIVIQGINTFAQPKGNTSSVPAKSIKAFEGAIKFMQQSLSDTLYYTYHIKDNAVRLDIHEGCQGCSGSDNSILFDLAKNTVTAISPARKIYVNVPVKPYKKQGESEFEIIKSKNNKVIAGYKCYQWRVKNKSQKTEISYWVAFDNFFFFDDFLKLWNRSEKHSVFFLQIPDIDGYFPMMSEERTLLREEKMKLSVVDIKKTKQEDNLFKIPDGYRNYDQ